MRLARWLWTDRGSLGRLGRCMLLPLAAAYRAGMALRAAPYRSGVRRVRRPVIPTIVVGNLMVGGAGKTPVVRWLAARLRREGAAPAVVLRGYGVDETLLHRRTVPASLVIADPDRLRAIRVARGRGASIALLDDGFQRRDFAADLSIVVLSAEAAERSPWLLPAGPWRERLNALARAQAVIVTRRCAARARARELEEHIRPHLPVAVPVAQAAFVHAGFEGLLSGRSEPPDALVGRRVLAACGIADPESFRQQLAARAARVDLIAFRDHQPFRTRHVRRLLQAGASADYVVVTEKDAVKLRPLWPPGVAEPLVALLDVTWESGIDAVWAKVRELAIPR